VLLGGTDPLHHRGSESQQPTAPPRPHTPHLRGHRRSGQALPHLDSTEVYKMSARSRSEANPKTWIRVADPVRGRMTD
jgi:hypothetical protein